MVREAVLDDIYIRYAINETPKVDDFHLHIHDKCEIYLCTEGEVDYLVEGTNYANVKNCLMLMRPAELHTPRFTGYSTYERYAIIFPVSLIREFDPKLTLLKAFFERPLGKENLYTKKELDIPFARTLFEEMSAECDEYTKRLRLKANLLTLLGMIDRSFSKKETSKQIVETQAEKFISYVNEHIFEKISVPEIADFFFLSPSQFSRIFKNATGASPWDYIIKKRLACAKEMIQNGESVQKACEKCGFGDYSVFYRAYVKTYGSAPKYEK